MIARLDAQIEDMLQPFQTQRELLTTIPGIGPFAAAAVISEAGADIAESFPSARHFASWIGVCPGNHESAGKRHSGKTGHRDLVGELGRSLAPLVGRGWELRRGVGPAVLLARGVGPHRVWVEVVAEPRPWLDRSCARPAH